ncbi:DnaD domain protein [Anaerovibrio sp. RM50]|uniref:DnaD domain protein n=1 Tax=Anaerovibrio sp. RM50 TaxID=1200557 RepID=UPI0009FEFBD4|nr:DnaD domain protein [Anaerovibrio sp. RM50]
MAERRMFAKDVIDSDNFLDMSLTTQALYFHLAMRADDDGFVNNCKRIQRMIGCSDDEMKMLIAKKYIIPFESGVIVIRHWKIHNYIRKDMYHPTKHVAEKNLIELNDGVYDVCDEEVNKLQLKNEPESIAKICDVDNSEKYDERFGKIFELYQNCIQPVPNMVVADDLQDLYEQYGAEWLYEAIKESARNGGRNVRYVAKVLNNWQTRGVQDPWNHPDKKQKGKQVSDIPQMDIAAKAIATLEAQENADE